MSRVGRVPVAVPENVNVTVVQQKVVVKGPHGELSLDVPDVVSVEFESAERRLRVVKRDSTSREVGAIHGLMRSLLANMVNGVSQLWEKRLEIVGVGYNVALADNRLMLNVGFANPVTIVLPRNVYCELPDATHVVLKSADRQLVGQMAADIRAVRPPEPYKGKGIRYADEYVRRKAGKAFGS